MIENPMVSGLDRELKQREAEDKAALACYAHHYDEWLRAVTTGPHASLSYLGDQCDISDVLTTMLASNEDLLSEFVAHLKHTPLMLDRFAAAFAQDQEDYTVGAGMLMDRWGASDV